MHPAAVYIKTLFKKGEITAEQYNAHVVSAVEQGLLKDVTPRTAILDIAGGQVVYAIVEFPDGDRYEIEIWKQKTGVNPKRDYAYHSKVNKSKFYL